MQVIIKIRGLGFITTDARRGYSTGLDMRNRIEFKNNQARKDRSYCLRNSVSLKNQNGYTLATSLAKSITAPEASTLATSNKVFKTESGFKLIESIPNSTKKRANSG
jgi:hypothetical protein